MGNRTRTKITKMRTRRPAARRSPIDRSCMALRELYTLKLSHRLRSVDQGRLSPPPVLRGATIGIRGGGSRKVRRRERRGPKAPGMTLWVQGTGRGHLLWGGSRYFASEAKSLL